MEVDRYEPGVPSWVDLGTPDIPKAIEFYSSLFGWQIEQGPEEAGGYSICLLRGKPVAGLGPQMNPGPPYWTTYVNVVSVDEPSARPSRRAATSSWTAMDVMDVGRMGIFAGSGRRRDLAVGAQGPHRGGHRQRAQQLQLERARHHRHRDVEDSSTARCSAGGLQTHGEGTPMPYTEWKVGDRSVGGMMPKPPMMPAEVPPHWGVYFSVDGTEAAIDKIK